MNVALVLINVQMEIYVSTHMEAIDVFVHADLKWQSQIWSVLVSTLMETAWKNIGAQTLLLIFWSMQEFYCCKLISVYLYLTETLLVQIQQ